MEYFIIENDYDGNHLIFKNEDKAKLQILRWYQEKVIPDIIREIHRLIDDTDLNDYTRQGLLQQIEAIQGDLKDLLDENYIESFAYCYSAEVIE